MLSAILSLVLFLFLQRVKESPYFLLVSKQYLKLMTVLNYISHVNNNDKEFNSYLSKVNLKKFETGEAVHSVKVYGINEVIKIQSIWFSLSVMCFNWFVMSMVYYGINFNILKFGGNPYLMGIIIYTSESLSQYISIFLIDYLGHKKTILFAYFICCINLLLFDYLDEYIYYKYILLFIAKFEISTVNSVNYIYTSGLYPTQIRIGSLSICSIFSRFGGILTTILIEIISWSMTLFGVLCCVSGVLLISLENSTEDIPELLNESSFEASRYSEQFKY